MSHHPRHRGKAGVTGNNDLLAQRMPCTAPDFLDISWITIMQQARAQAGPNGPVAANGDALFRQPVLVVALAEFFERLHAPCLHFLMPQPRCLLFERLEETHDAAVAFAFPYKSGRGIDAQREDLEAMAGLP